MPVTTAEAQSRMRAKLAELAAAGINRVLLYGAGRHTLKVGEVLGNAPLEIVGIIDDRRGGDGERLWNWPILTPDQAVDAGAEAVIISSDAGEADIWRERGPWLSARGLPVHRLYTSDPSDAVDDTGTFTDSTGRDFRLIPGYRSQVKPGWEEMLTWEPGNYPSPTHDQALAAMRQALRRVRLLEKYLQVHGLSVAGREVLEVGCWDGACTFALAMSGVRGAVGIDHQDYFLWNVDPAEITVELRDAAARSLLAAQSATLRAARELGYASPPMAPVELHNADIAAAGLPEGRFDLLAAWQTLEHLVPPERGLAAFARLLRPGGICFCEYGAFTCRKGGHALVTLDFPWGHLRLSDEDVDRYLRERRPREHAHAIRHYRDYLNRLTLGDLHRIAAENHLEVLHVLPWLNRAHFEDEFEPDYLLDARAHHPTLRLEDMIHDDLWVLLRRRST